VDVCGFIPVCTDKGVSMSQQSEHDKKEVVMVQGPLRWMSVASYLCAQTKERPCHNRVSMKKVNCHGTRGHTVDVCGFTPAQIEETERLAFQKVHLTGDHHLVSGSSRPADAR